MEIRGVELGYPHLLLAGLTVLLFTGTIIGLSTSSTAFGSYNTDWDGTQELRTMAVDRGTETEIAESTKTYDQIRPNATIGFVLSPTSQYSQADVTRIGEFLERGGTLVVASDFQPHANTLLRDLGVDSRFDGRPLRDAHQYYRSPAFPVATNVRSTSPTRNVSRLTLNHPTTIHPSSAATVLVNSSGYAYLDVNRNGSIDQTESIGRRPTVVSERYGHGRVILVSDPSIFINSMLDAPDNREFAGNLLTSAETTLFDYSHRSGIPWAVGIVLRIANVPALQFLVITTFVALGYLTWIGALPPSWRRAAGEAAGPSVEDSIYERFDSREDLFAALKRHHPEKDEQRLQRIADQILERRSE